MPVDTKLRKRVRVLLAEHDMDQQDLAIKAGLAPLTISNFLRGRSNDVKLSTIESMARVLGCTVKVLLEDIEPDD